MNGTKTLTAVQICENNLDFTNTPHTPMKRDGVLFITQRRQATSDIRENPLVRKLYFCQTAFIKLLHIGTNF